MSDEHPAEWRYSHKGRVAELKAEVARLTAERDDARGTIAHLEAELRVAKSHAASDRRSATDERLKAERVTADLAAARAQAVVWRNAQTDPPPDRPGLTVLAENQHGHVHEAPADFVVHSSADHIVKGQAAPRYRRWAALPLPPNDALAGGEQR